MTPLEPDGGDGGTESAVAANKACGLALQKDKVNSLTCD